MLKKLLLTVALLSSTYGSNTHLVDPDFSILANRADWLVVNGNEVVINCIELEPNVLHRFTQSHVFDALNSNDIDILLNTMDHYTKEIWCVQWIHICLTSDTTGRWGVTPEQDAVLLSQVFWNRVAAMVQTLKAIVDLPTEVMDAESIVYFNQLYVKLINFSETHSHSDTSSFATSYRINTLPLIDAFAKAYYPPALIETPASNSHLSSDTPSIAEDISRNILPKIEFIRSKL
jgi:hypothetical protein